MVQPYLGTIQSLLNIWVPLSRLASPVALYLRSVLDRLSTREKKGLPKGVNLDVPGYFCRVYIRLDGTLTLSIAWILPPNQSLTYDTLTFDIRIPRVLKFCHRQMSFPSFLLGQGIFHPLSVESSILCERKMAILFRSRGVNSNGEIGDEYYEVVGRPRMTSTRQQSFGM